MPPRTLRLLVLIALALGVSAVIAWWQVERELTDRRAARSLSAVAVGGPFELVDHTGAAVTERSFGDRLLLVYFGYTYCPDVCPTELAAMVSVLDLLDDEAALVQPLFVTIDPERDTPEALAGYVDLFHPRLVGLAGSEAEIAAAARAYRVFYAKAETDDPAGYLMDHSSFIYLMAADGTTNLAVFPHGTPPDAMADAIRVALAGV